MRQGLGLRCVACENGAVFLRGGQEEEPPVVAAEEEGRAVPRLGGISGEDAGPFPGEEGEQP